MPPPVPAQAGPPAPAPPRSPAIHESRARRIIFALLLLLILGLYARALSLHWYPANPGTDQNGYLVGGKLLATTGTDGTIPANVYSFVASMWNLGPDGRTFYPKYPLGLPALYAACIRLFRVSRGVVAAYWVSPAAAVLSVAGLYQLARPYVGGFAAILAGLILAVSPLTLSLATNPNSHAATLAFVTWGMAFLLAWWRRGGWHRALPAGFLLGYALTIRYTEGLLLLPMSIAFLDRWVTRQRGAYWQGLLLAAAWSLPVGALLWFNLAHFGSPTGYDSTRESTGFGWTYFVANWDLMLRELNDKALFLIFPLGIAGISLMLARRGGGAWKLGLILAAWILPSLLLYTAYYWAPDNASVAYGRFFLTILPPLLLGAMWLLSGRVASFQLRVARAEGGSSLATINSQLATLLAPTVLTLLATAASAAQDAEVVIPDARANMLIDLAASYARRLPPHSVILTQQPLIHHLQFITDLDCYTPETFTRSLIQRLNQQAEVDDPNPMQPQRAAALYAVLKDKTDAQLVAEENAIMDAALAAGRHVYFLEPLAQLTNLRRRFLPPNRYDARVLSQWSEPADWRRTRWQRPGVAAVPTWAGRRRDITPAPSSGPAWQLLEITRHPSPPPAPPKLGSTPTTRPPRARPPRSLPTRPTTHP